MASPAPLVLHYIFFDSATKGWTREFQLRCAFPAGKVDDRDCAAVAAALGARFECDVIMLHLRKDDLFAFVDCDPRHCACGKTFDTAGDLRVQTTPTLLRDDAKRVSGFVQHISYFCGDRACAALSEAQHAQLARPTPTLRSKTRKLAMCFRCGKLDQAMATCGGCNHAKYCNTKCQKADRTAHSVVCRKES